MPVINGAVFDRDGNPVARIKVEAKTLNEATFSVVGRIEGQLPMDEPADIKLYDPINGLVDYTGTIESVTDGKINIVGLRSAVRKDERRKDVKVMVNRPVFLLGKFETEGAEEIRKFSARLRDIGAGGVCVITAEPLDMEAKYELIFDLADQPDLLGLNLLRHTQNELGEHVYGCSFKPISAARESRIREYVFRRQLGLIGKIRSDAIKNKDD
jgi:hypothetical protein